MANKTNAAASGPTARRRRQPASVPTRAGKVTDRAGDSVLGGPKASALKVAGVARKNQAPEKNQRVALHARRTPGSAGPGKLAKRLVDTGLRLHALRDSDALYASLIDEAARFSGAQRVLLVLIGPDGLRIAGSLMPQDEEARTLLHAITPWLSEASRTRAVSLRHGPEGADPIDQRSCLIAPLIAQHELLGYLYADIEGACRPLRRRRPRPAGDAGVTGGRGTGQHPRQRGAGAQGGRARGSAGAAHERARSHQQHPAGHGRGRSTSRPSSTWSATAARGAAIRRRPASCCWDAPTGTAHALYAFERGVRMHVPPRRPNVDGPMFKALQAKRPVIANNRAEMTAWGLRTVDRHASRAWRPP